MKLSHLKSQCLSNMNSFMLLISKRIIKQINMQYQYKISNMLTEKYTAVASEVKLKAVYLAFVWVWLFFAAAASLALIGSGSLAGSEEFWEINTIDINSLLIYSPS